MPADGHRTGFNQSPNPESRAAGQGARCLLLGVGISGKRGTSRGDRGERRRSDAIGRPRVAASCGEGPPTDRETGRVDYA